MTKKKLRVAVVAPKYGMVGGIERFVMELTERIACYPDFSIHVIANEWKSVSDRVTFHKFPIITFPRFFRPISAALSIQQIIAKNKYDLIHSHERIFMTDIYSIHGIPHKYWINNVRKKKRLSLFDYCTHWVEKKMVMNARCRHYLSVSELTRTIFIDSLSVKSDSVKVIHPGVDLKPFNALDRKQCRMEIRERLGLKLSDIILLFVGMNFEIKGLSSLIKAVAKSIQHNSAVPLKLVIVGKGNYSRYSKLAAQLGIPNNVVFTGVLEEDIEKVYLASDLFSMLSEFDAFGMTVLEAMAASIPVIISDHVGAKDIIQQGENGYIVERHNIDQISTSINALLDEAHRKNISKLAYKTSQNYSWDHTANQVIDIYKSYIPQI